MWQVRNTPEVTYTVGFKRRRNEDLGTYNGRRSHIHKVSPQAQLSYTVRDGSVIGLEEELRQSGVLPLGSASASHPLRVIEQEIHLQLNRFHPSDDVIFRTSLPQ